METPNENWLVKTVKMLDLRSLRNNRRLIVFSICLAIATVLWFLNALSKSYTAVVSYPVKYLNAPKNKFIVNDPPEKFDFLVRAHGFTLLRNKFSLSFSPIVLDLTALTNESNKLTSSSYSVSTASVRERIAGQVSSEIEILQIQPESFILAFDSLGVKQVPVALRGDFILRPQFEFASAFRITPKMVTVTAPRALLAEIDSIYTVKKTYRNIDSPISEEIKLEIPRKASVNPGQVLVQIPVEEFTENSFPVSVSVKDLPAGTRVRLFPQEVEISFRIGLSQFSKVTARDFRLSVSYHEITQGAPKLRIIADKVPASVKSLKITPDYVEYLIEKN